MSSLSTSWVFFKTYSFGTDFTSVLVSKDPFGDKGVTEYLEDDEGPIGA